MLNISISAENSVILSNPCNPPIGYHCSDLYHRLVIYHSDYISGYITEISFDFLKFV